MRFGRFDPKPNKTQITIRLDEDVLRWFRDQGEGYNALINKALKQYKEQAEQVGRPG